MEYLSGIQSTMESEIQSASDAIIAELERILFAIMNPGKPLPDSLMDGVNGDGAKLGEEESAEFIAERQAEWAALNPGYVPPQGGTYIDMRGATVYGYEDFESKIQSAWMTGYRRGAYDSALG
jgi:hypothetical protein